MFSFVSCANASSNFMTKQGLYFETNGHDVSKSDVEIATDLFAITADVSNVIPGLTEGNINYIFHMTDYVIHVRKNVLLCPTEKDPDRTCQGLHYRPNVGSKWIKYVHHDRLSDTSFVHELIHMVLSNAGHDADRFHNDVLLWELACQKVFSSDSSSRITCEMNCLEGKVNSMIRGLEDVKESIKTRTE